MPTDFAGRNRKPKRKKATRKRKQVSPRPRVLFHGPSFSSGAIIGAAVVILAAYAPEWLDAQKETVQSAPEESFNMPTVEFDFPKLLEEIEVKPDLSAYPVPEQSPDQAPAHLNIQAASFRLADDANALRAKLILRDLPASVDTSVVESSVWFRVVVGPFANKTLANRAMTQLREMYLRPIWMNNDN
ncbi:MAG: cell division protein FtsN [Limisphaerales bacterium]|jgi:cell division protein FtsN